MSTVRDRVKARGFRVDIQGLRGVAVGAVVFYHIWPELLPGGYVGVDIFFVISGYLITRHVVHEIESSGNIDIVGFYARRARRLLPAASFALLTVGLAAIILLPVIRWQDASAELLASTLYVENLLLYSRATDYLAQGLSPSPFQHFWSLSVEEQFYLLSPPLLALALLVPRPRVVGVRQLVALVAFGSFSLSFAASIYVTSTNAAAAYLLTVSRLWELCLGALIAIWPIQAKQHCSRLCVGWLGAVGIIGAVLFFSDETPFPGYVALLPTVAASFVLMSQHGGPWSVQRILSLRPLVYIGDLSYSLYLWHWPILVFFVAANRARPSMLDGGALLVSSVVAAHFSRQYIERMLEAERTGVRLLAICLTMVFSCIALSGAMWIALWRVEAVTARPEQTLASSHPGAEVFRVGADPQFSSKSVPFIPDLLHARSDVADLYRDGCHTPQPSAEVLSCSYGSSDAETVIAIVGDSHAAQWLPAFQVAELERGWRIVTFTKSSCFFGDVLVRVGTAEYQTCLEWSHRVLAKILALRPSLVVTSQITNHFAMGADSLQSNLQKLADGALRMWDRLTDAGIPILTIRDTPRLGFDVPDCLAIHAMERQKCGATREEALKMDDALLLAARRSKNAYSADFTDAICLEKLCPPIIGNVLVYRDVNHLTATYARTLGPRVINAAEAAMNSRR